MVASIIATFPLLFLMFFAGVFMVASLFGCMTITVNGYKRMATPKENVIAFAITSVVFSVLCFLMYLIWT